MRIHTILLNTAKEFFKNFRSDRFIYEFVTKAVFSKEEQIILELFINQFAEREHFRVQVLRVGTTKGNLRRVWVKLLPYQSQKIEFLTYLTKQDAKWSSKRAHSRQAVSIQGAWSYDYDAPDLWHPCEIKDVGMGGVQFFGAVAPSTDAKLHLRFPLPGVHQPVKISSQVVWVKQMGPGSYTVGLKFRQSKTSSRYKRAIKLLHTFLRKCEIHGNCSGLSNKEKHSTT